MISIDVGEPCEYEVINKSRPFKSYIKTRDMSSHSIFTTKNRDECCQKVKMILEARCKVIGKNCRKNHERLM